MGGEGGLLGEGRDKEEEKRRRAACDRYTLGSRDSGIARRERKDRNPKKTQTVEMLSAEERRGCRGEVRAASFGD